jgi:hypothetical protein
VTELEAACLVCIFIYIGEHPAVVIQEVESTGTATIVDIQQTSQVKAGDKITAIGTNHESLEYLALPGTTAYLTSDAVTIVDKVQKAQDSVRLQLERPLEKVLGF